MRHFLVAAVILCFGAPVWGQTKPSQTLAGFPFGSRALACAVTSDGKTAVVAGSDKTLRLFDLASGKELKKANLPAEPSVVGVSADGKNIVVGGHRGPLQILDASGKKVKEIAKDTNAAGVSRDGALMAAAVTPMDMTVTIFSVPDGKKVSQVKLTDEASSLSFSADHSLLAIGLFGGADNLLLVDTKTGQIKGKFKHGAKQVTAVLSPDGSTIASNGNYPENQGLSLFDVKTGKSTPVAECKSDNARMAFYPDGKTMLYASGRDVVAVDVAGAKVTGKVTAPGEQTNAILVTGDKLLLRTQPQMVEVWNLD